MDIRTFTDEMSRLAGSVDAGAADLDEMGRSPLGQAGESIQIVADAIGRLSGACAGASGGLHQAADQVRAAKDTYLHADDHATQGLPKPH